MLRRIKVWQLLLIVVALVALSAFLLRQNNIGMIERRNAVKQADEKAGDINAALTELQRYVYAHMNTSLGEGVFLEHSYQRAYDMAVQEAATKVNPNSQAYGAIETACRQDYARSGSFSGYITCVQNRLKALAPGTDPLSTLKPPPVEAFKHNFVSPLWSPDFAGFAVLLTLLLAFVTVLRLVAYLLLHLVLKVRIKQ